MTFIQVITFLSFSFILALIVFLRSRKAKSKEVATLEENAKIAEEKPMPEEQKELSWDDVTHVGFGFACRDFIAWG